MDPNLAMKGARMKRVIVGRNDFRIVDRHVVGRTHFLTTKVNPRWLAEQTADWRGRLYVPGDNNSHYYLAF